MSAISGMGSGKNQTFHHTSDSHGSERYFFGMTGFVLLRTSPQTTTTSLRTSPQTTTTSLRTSPQTGVAISGMGSGKKQTFHHTSDFHGSERYFFGMTGELSLRTSPQTGVAISGMTNYQVLLK